MLNERELLMIPGPTMVSPRVLRVLSKPLLSHVSSEFVNAFAEALELQKKIFVTDGTPFIIAGSGTLGMEAAVANIVEKGEKVLCVENGYFGEKWEGIIEAHGGQVDRLRFEWGEALDVKLVKEKLHSGDYKAFTVEHVDTSTGIANPIEKIGDIAKDTDALYIVDSVCGIGGMPLKMDEWNVDFCLTGSQKAVGAPPGISLFCLNEKAINLIENRKTPIENHYADLIRWKPVMVNQTKYFATPAVGMILGIREALSIIIEEGLERRWKRHKVMSEAFREGLKALNIDSFPAKGHEAHTLTVPAVPKGIDDKQIRNIMSSKYGVVIAGGLGKLGGKTVRIGHMGNTMYNDIIATMSAFEMALKELGYELEPGSAVGAIESVILGN